MSSCIKIAPIAMSLVFVNKTNPPFKGYTILEILAYVIAFFKASKLA
jgi:hypothetical protein